MKNPERIMVTPDGPEDGGDFGPNTPGTKTSGIQEALDHAKASTRDVYIAGGGLRKAFEGGTSYVLEETLRVPWNQNWRLDGGEYWLFYEPERGDAVVIDSQMNCRIKMGLIVNNSSPDAVVRLCPSSKGPDDFRCVVASKFEFNGMVGAGDAWGKPGAVQKSTGLLMDCTAGGGISGNNILIGEINACNIGIHLMEGCHSNRIEATWIHLTKLGIRVGDDEAHSVSRNVIQAGISGDLPGTTGVQIFGSDNLLTIEARNHGPDRGIVFERSSRGNFIEAICIPDGITNKAEISTNRIVPAQPGGFSIATPQVPPSGEVAVNRFTHTVEALIIDGGRVREWVLTDRNGFSQRLHGSFFPGQSLILEPGDAVTFFYTQAPTWRWRALSW